MLAPHQAHYMAADARHAEMQDWQEFFELDPVAFSARGAGPERGCG